MVSLEKYRQALGRLADGLTDAELQERLDYTYRFMEGLYGWWNDRKDYGYSTMGKYSIDTVTDLDRQERDHKMGKPLPKTKRKKSDVEWVEYSLPPLDPVFMAGVRELWKMKKQNLSR